MQDIRTMVGEVTLLFCRDDFYRTRKITSISNVAVPALMHNKYKVWVKDKKLVGFCTYAFLTDEEIEKNRFNGFEAFARKEGEKIHFTQFVCRAGRRETFRFVRQIQRDLSKQYPNKTPASGLRVKLDGSTRPEKWFRKEIT